jgi:DNA-binding phage protein
MRDRIPIHEVTRAPRRYRAEGLDSEESLSGAMEAAAEEGSAGVLWALPIVALARLFNQLAPATGIDRRRLCGALDGGPPLDDAEVQKVLEYFNVRVSIEMETPAGVG